MKLKNDTYLIFLILSLFLPVKGLVAEDGDGVTVKKMRLTAPGNGAAAGAALPPPPAHKRAAAPPAG